MIHRYRLPLALAAAALLLTSAVEAQQRAPLGIDARGRANGIATTNPFVILLGGFNADVELNFGEGFTGALSATFSGSEIDYSTVDATFRYYPAEEFPRGFWVGASVGRLHWDKGGSSETRGLAIGFIGGYNSVVGRGERLVVTYGVGLKRVFDRGNRPDPVSVVPTGRLGIGLSF